MTKEGLEQFLDTLRRAKWNVSTKSHNTLDLNAEFLARYPRIPEAYLDFLRHTVECSNPAQNAWFLCTKDYNACGGDDNAFRWDEWEQISLEAAEGDEALIGQIRHFWDCHFPIMSSVVSDYAYLAISLDVADYGAIIYGYGPAFEDSATFVCNTFDEFLSLFGDIVAGKVSVKCQNSAGIWETRREFSDFV